MTRKTLKEIITNEIQKSGWSETERADIMNNMKKHLGEKKPEVGSFYYDLENKKLMLVDSMPTELARENDNGIKTTDKLHIDIWEENGMSGNYMDYPRGRVFYNTKTDEYEIMVGQWANQANNVKDLVVKRFHLEGQKVNIKQDNHWDIGNGFDGDNVF